MQTTPRGWDSLVSYCSARGHVRILRRRRVEYALLLGRRQVLVLLRSRVDGILNNLPFRTQAHVRPDVVSKDGQLLGYPTKTVRR